MNLKDLLESALKEIDRQIQATGTPTPEQSLIWTIAAQELDAIKTRLYRPPQKEQT